MNPVFVASGIMREQLRRLNSSFFLSFPNFFVECCYKKTNKKNHKENWKPTELLDQFYPHSKKNKRVLFNACFLILAIFW